MRIKSIIRIAATAALGVIPMLANAQLSSINTFSPYTFYGLGDFHTQGAANLRSMGGAAVGYRAFVTTNGVVNYTNPASLSSTPRYSFHFNFGMEGSNSYLRTYDKKTSYNTFNIRDIAFQMPLANRLALGISLTPYSSVGYRTEIDETDPDILDQLYQGGAIGAKYLYAGSGDVSQAKFSIGWEPVKNLSIGVDMVYYFGKLSRDFTTSILPRSSDAGYINSQVAQTERISRIMWNLGAQYSLISNNYRQLTLGATYNLGGKLNPEVSTSLSVVQAINNGLTDQFELPGTLTVGLAYQTWKMSVGLDYTYQGWGGLNKDSEIAGGDGSVGMKFRSTNAFRGGIEYTPERNDVRKLFRRFTYRAGVKYSDYYMTFNDTNINDMGFTLGIGMPFRYESRSYIDIGFEYGRRGTTKKDLIREDYFKVSVGFRLFGTDGWFVKMLFD